MNERISHKTYRITNRPKERTYRPVHQESVIKGGIRYATNI